MTRQSESEIRLLEKSYRNLAGNGLGNMDLDRDLDLVVKRGLGSRIWDFSGNEYIDYLMGSGPMVLGHAHPAVVEAVKTAVEDGSTFFTSTEAAILLAEELVKAIACADKVRFTTSGTDACFQALRLARSFRGRDKVLKFEGGFHGTSDYALVGTFPKEPTNYPHPQPEGGGIPGVLQDLMLIAPYNDSETTTAIIEKHHDDLAAVIIEPMQRFLSPRPGFLQSLREITAHYEIPLIFDEIVTGFRLAYGGAQEYYGVVPDMAAVGKIVGGGYPLAAICGREDLMAGYDREQVNSDDYVCQIGTLNGNPVASSAGLATLRELRRDGTYEQLWNTGRRLRQALERLCAEAEIPAQTSGEDPVFDIVFSKAHLSDYRSTVSADIPMNLRFRNLLQGHGVLRGPQKFYPSLAHNEEDIDQTINAFAAVMNELSV